MTDDESTAGTMTEGDHGVTEHKAHVREEAAAGNGLAVVSIAKSYDKRVVLSDVSLSVGKGEVVGLLGPNGAGKTTCFYSVMGLVKPDAGRIMLDGVDITPLPMYRRAILGLGYLPQETSIFRGLTVAKNISAVLELSEPDKGARAARLDQLLEEFGLTRLRDAPAMALSGGERRRAEIARALAADPSIMLLDEPFAGIDPISIADIRDLVKELKTRNIGVLITDHNVRETLDIVDRASIIYDGRVLFAGSPEDLVADPMSAVSIWAKASRSDPMSLAPRLDLRQSQSLVMTPQLQQAIKLLALSNLEIETFIAEELEKNPLLDAGGGEEREPAEAPDAEPAIERDGPADSTELLDGGDATGEASLDVDLAAETFHHDSAATVGGLSGAGIGGEAGRGWSRLRQLLREADLTPCTIICSRRPASGSVDRCRPVAPSLIDQIDEAGYLRPIAARARGAARCAARAGRRDTGADPDARPDSASARATSPSVWRSRRARPIATTPQWRR
jgi:lipopolysaccharide export system ATP-binding protein